jgi:hypothetical protein
VTACCCSGCYTESIGFSKFVVSERGNIDGFARHYGRGIRHLHERLRASTRNIVTIDWTMRESVRAPLRVIIKRILRKYGYPPDKQEKATQTVLEQVELLGWEVAA